MFPTNADWNRLRFGTTPTDPQINVILNPARSHIFLYQAGVNPESYNWLKCRE